MVHFNCPASLTTYGMELPNARTVFVHVSKDDKLQILGSILILEGTQ